MAATTMTVEQFTPGSTSTRSLPRPVSYLGAVDPSTGLPRRPSFSLSLFLSLGLSVKHFLIACAFLMSPGLLAFSVGQEVREGQLQCVRTSFINAPRPKTMATPRQMMMSASASERVSSRIASAGRWKKPCPFLICDERVSTTIDKVTWRIHQSGHKVRLVK